MTKKQSVNQQKKEQDTILQLPSTVEAISEDMMEEDEEELVKRLTKSSTSLKAAKKSNKTKTKSVAKEETEKATSTKVRRAKSNSAAPVATESRGLSAYPPLVEAIPDMDDDDEEAIACLTAFKPKPRKDREVSKWGNNKKHRLQEETERYTSYSKPITPVEPIVEAISIPEGEEEEEYIIRFTEEQPSASQGQKQKGKRGRPRKNFPDDSPRIMSGPIVQMIPDILDEEEDEMQIREINFHDHQDTINSRFRSIRKMLRLSQSEFGKQLGITQTSIGQIERGINGPSVKVVEQICVAFHLSPWWVICGRGEKFSAPPPFLDPAQDKSRKRGMNALHNGLLPNPPKDMDTQMRERYIDMLEEQIREKDKVIETLMQKLASNQ